MKRVEQIEHSIHNLASPKRGHTFWGLILLLIVAAILIWIKHGNWLDAPNDFMLAGGPDGLKNYLTSAWHVQHDSSYVHYSGMNYPFGEHVLFTDNQPILSAAIKWWSRHVSDVGNGVVGIINVVLVLSLLLATAIIYLLLRKLHLPVWYASLASLGIAFLSPQNNRFDGHFGLAHIWVIPMLLFLLCRYEERQSRRYQSLLIGILIWFAAQLHFYNFGVSAVFLGFYTLFQILIDRSWRNIWTRASHLAVMVLLPFALLNVWLHWSDYYSDRPANPYGFTTYIGYWEGVFLPYENFPLYHWIDNHITKIRRIDFESQAYAGVVAFAFTLWLILRRRFRLFDEAWESAAYHRVHKNYLRGICFAGFAMLLFGCGFPFAIKGMEWMVDYLGPFRQFRGLGRFTWAFYYSINVVIFYVLWNISQHSTFDILTWRPKLPQWFAKKGAVESGTVLVSANPRSQLISRRMIAILPVVILCWEAYFFQKHKTLNLSPNLAQHSVVAASPDNWLNKVDFGRFQALMPLPYYHVGSENIWLETYFPLYQKVQYTALQTGVPDMGVNMSRSSVGNMVKSMQFSLLPCQTPELLSELPDTRPIALMIAPELWEQVKSRYAHLVSKATMVYDGPELRIMSVVPDSVRAWAQERPPALSAEMNKLGTYNAGNGWFCDTPPKWFAYMNFDSLTPKAQFNGSKGSLRTTSKYTFQGKGAGEANLGDTTFVWRDHIPKGYYFFSVWVKVDEDMGMTSEVKIIENRRGDGREVHLKHEGLRFYLQSIVNGWALFDLPFEVYEDNSNINIFFHKKNANATFWFDEAMIKDAGFTLYRREPGWMIRNDFWYQNGK